MAKDFKASQIRTAKIVVSGTESGKPALLVYSASAATDFAGGFQSDMLTKVGGDVYLFVSGNNSSVLSGDRSNVTLFGGDVVVSGTFYAEKLVAEVDTTTNSDHHISGAIYLTEKASEPDVDADQLVLYASDVGGVSKLFFKNTVGATEIGSGGGSTTGSFNEVSNPNAVPTTFVTTSSFSLAGESGESFGVSSIGADVFQFVSGTKSRADTSLKEATLPHSRSVYGGDLVVSGNFLGEGSVVGYSDIVLNRSDFPGNVLGGIGRVSDTNSISLFNSQSTSAGGEIKVQGFRSSGGAATFDYMNISGDGASGFGGAKTINVLPKDGGETEEPIITFLSGGSVNSVDEKTGNDVSIYFSGSGDSLDSRKGVTLFGGDVAASGTLKLTRDNNRSSNAALITNQSNTDAGDDGSIAHNLIAGFSGYSSGEGSSLVIKKSGPNNTAALGGPFANTFQAKSGSLLLRAGGSEHEYNGSQSVTIDDIHATNFLVATGSHLSGSARVLILSGGAPASVDQQSGQDVNFFVSGSSGTKGTSTRGTSLFAGDVVISGTLYDGTGATIGSGGGSITVVSSSTSLGTTTQIDFTEIGILNDNGSGEAALTGTIGNPEDGSYADGLFTTFTPHTTIGTAIDKINEVLKFLAPSPAPNLDDINANSVIGGTALLAFGDASGNNPASYSIVPSTMPSGNTLSTVDVNQSFTVATGSGGDLRLGIFQTYPTITGDLNSDIAASDYNGGAIVNHPEDSFGDAEQGSLVLEVNGAEIVTVDLTPNTAGSGVPGSGASDHFGSGDHSSSGFIQLSQSGSARTQSDSEFPIFQHRTGKFNVSFGSMNKGYNYAKVKHVIGSTTRTTNFVEWVYDEDGTDGVTPISANGSGFVIDSLDGGTNRFDLSGVRYAVTASGEYRVRVENFYKHVYAQNSITNAVSNSSISLTTPSTVPTIDTGASEDHTKHIHVTSSFATTTSPMLGSTITGDITLAHPTKTGLTNAGSVTSGRFLIYSGAVDSTNTLETFNIEDFRLQSGSFSTQGDVTGGTYDWVSHTHMTSSNGGHSDGLQFYNGALKSPTQTLNSGDFRSSGDGGSYFGAGFTYDSQPNYSGESGLRTFYRKIQNTSGNPISDFKIQLNQGSTTIPTIVSEGTSLGATNLKVFARLPGEVGSEWLDLGSQFTLGQTTNRSGGRANTTLNTGGSPINYFTFGTGTVANNEYFVIKVEADAALNREIGGLTFTVPGIAGTTVEAPALDAINSLVSGQEGKLSFGSTVPLTGFSSVNTDGGGSATDINGTFSVTGNRHGIIDGSTSITGTLNHDVSANGNNYPADAFSANPNSAQVRVVVNGVVKHTLSLADAAFSGEEKTSDTGFQNISEAKNATGSDGLVPDFTKWYRTGEFAVGFNDMRDGHNYAKVEAYDGASWGTTNFIEWVRDTDSSALSLTNNTFAAFEEANTEGVYFQSGVKYFQTAKGNFMSQVDHAYSNVYSADSDAIKITSVSNLNNAAFTQVTGSSTVLSDASSNQMSLPSLDTSLGEPTTGSIFVTGTVTFNQSTSLPGAGPIGGTSHAAAAKIEIKHPLNGTQSSGDIYVGGNSSKKFLVFSASVGSSNENTTERFGREDFRIVSGNYTAQGDVSTNAWNSSTDMNDSANIDYYNGMLVYNGNLVSPSNSSLPGGGDFRSHFDVGSSDVISPASNVNYSSLPAVSSSHRYYYRSFENNTVNNVFNVDVTLFGSANIVGRDGALSGSLGADSNIYVEGKIPGKTGWLDLGRATAGSGNTSDGDGGLNGDIDQAVDSIGAANNLTFNGQTVNGTGTGAEKIVLKITAHADWTGYISRIDVSY